MIELPKFTLAEVQKWPIKMGFYLQLDHGLMGTFPAIFADSAGENTREVVVFDKGILLNKVWPLMTPRKSKLSSQTFYVNKKLGIAFPVDQAENMIEHNRSQIPPIKFATEAEIDDLIATNSNPFIWAPGLISYDMNEDEFKRTIEAAARYHRVQLDAEPEPLPVC